jgi:hypothetical protein
MVLTDGLWEVASSSSTAASSSCLRNGFLKLGIGAELSRGLKVDATDRHRSRLPFEPPGQVSLTVKRRPPRSRRKPRRLH